MTDPILSRFDILSVIKDDVDEQADDALATFVINSHIKSHPDVKRDLKVGEDPNQMPENEELERKEATKEWLNRNLLDDNRIKSQVNNEMIS